MSAPSRRPEIRRRRTRHHKVASLRKRLASAQNNDERSRIKRAINELLGSEIIEEKQYVDYRDGE